MEDLQAASVRLSHVLDDIGASKSMIMYRRRKFLLRETALTTAQHSKSGNNCIYHFGSQTEGTSTPGMGSDLDILINNTDVNVFLDSKDWKSGMFNWSIVPASPRHCRLLIYDPIEPVFSCESGVPFTSYDVDGRLLIQPTAFEHTGREVHTEGGKKLIKHGPSVSNSEDRDYISCVSCQELPPSCRDWLHRPRASDWFTQDFLTMISQIGMFLLPVGHPESEDSIEEWRFSPSLIERQLIFQLNSTQLRVYILLKLMKKSLTKAVVQDHLTSFHLKTVLLFTVDNTPACIWTEGNLLLCFLLALEILRKFLNHTYCPHYIVQNNLFIGKLPFHEISEVTRIIENILDNPIKCVLSIQCEDLGARMMLSTTKVLSSGVQSEMFPSRQSCNYDTKLAILLTLMRRINSTYCEMMNDTLKCTSIQDLKQYVTRHVEYFQKLLTEGSPYEQTVAKVLYPKCCSVLASLMTASASMSFNIQSIPDQALYYYAESLNGGLAESLRFASMWYCRRNFAMAADTLQWAAATINNEMYGICEGRHTEVEGTEPLTMETLDMPEHLLFSKYMADCVQFNCFEATLVPEELGYEMRRSTSSDRQFRHCEAGWHDEWMDQACVDCKPFLYYLQFLTYRELNDIEKSATAFEELQQYVLTAKIEHGHYETALHLLAHCYKLDGDVNTALELYNLSLAIYPHNNAADWFIAQTKHVNFIDYMSNTQPNLYQLLQTLQDNPHLLDNLINEFNFGSL